MDIENLNTELIDSMSTEDLRTTLKEAYVSRTLEKMREYEAAQAEEAKRAEGQRVVDEYFAAKLAKQQRNGNR